MRRTPATHRTKPVAYGANTEEVLIEAGYSIAEIKMLIRSQAVLTERK